MGKWRFLLWIRAEMAMTHRTGKAYLSAWKWAGLIGFLNFICLGIMFLSPDRLLASWASDIGAILIPLVASVCCFGFHRSAGYRRLSQVRFLPMVLGWFSLIYGLGMMVYAYETRILHRSGNPGWGDLFFLMQYPILVAAINLWPAKPLPGAMRWRTWSDAFVLVTALFAFGWVYLVGPAVKESDMNSLGILIDTAYPVFDILVIFSILQMMRKALDPRFRIATYLFVAGLTVNVLGDLYYALAQMDGGYRTGIWMDIAWPLTCSLCALAGLLLKIRMEVPGFREIQNNDKIVASQRTWTLYAPYVLVPGVGILVLHVSQTYPQGLIVNGLYLCGLTLVVAILIRQLIVIAENGNLYQSLREAYGELENKNMQVSIGAEEVARANALLRQMTNELEGRNRFLAETNEALEHMATRDGMTGLANHRAFQERLREEVANSVRQGHPLALALIDVDFFKQYNDHYGHPAGDEVLRSIARLLQESTRAGDLAARYGGEEFAMLLPYVSREEAVLILERLREAVSTFPFKHRRVTLSIGLSLNVEEPMTAEEMIDWADRALYAAKSRGRNQMVVASDLQGQVPAESETGSMKLDGSTPMGFGEVLSAGLQYHPQALAQEPQCALIAGLLATLELKDPLTRGYSLRVMWFSMRIAQACQERKLMELTPATVRALGFGALLHDIGRLGILESVLRSKESFTPEMREEFQKHARIGAELVKKFPGLSAAIPIIEHHHERWDGRGYPDQISGEQIPKGARILAYADAINAMSMDRPYAPKLSYTEIVAEITSNAGRQFDPGILEAFLSIPEAEWDRLRTLDGLDLVSHSRAA